MTKIAVQIQKPFVSESLGNHTQNELKQSLRRIPLHLPNYYMIIELLNLPIFKFNRYHNYHL